VTSPGIGNDLPPGVCDEQEKASETCSYQQHDHKGEDSPYCLYPIRQLYVRYLTDDGRQADRIGVPSSGTVVSDCHAGNWQANDNLWRGLCR